VLRGAGLKEAPPGVFRSALKRAYVVNWVEEGRQRAKQFGFHSRPELEVFLEAVKLRRAIEKKLSGQ
jgi:hypothetical protein